MSAGIEAWIGREEESSQRILATTASAMDDAEASRRSKILKIENKVGKRGVTVEHTISCGAIACISEEQDLVYRDAAPPGPAPAAVTRYAGVAPEVLLDAVAKGSGDSFALRNHARKSMLPRQFPEKSFPRSMCVLKDISYVLELARQVGVSTHVTELARRYYAAAASNGWSGRYYPAVIEVVDRGIDLGE